MFAFKAKIITIVLSIIQPISCIAICVVGL